jgi:hypothetical protein
VEGVYYCTITGKLTKLTVVIIAGHHCYLAQDRDRWIALVKFLIGCTSSAELHGVSWLVSYMLKKGFRRIDPGPRRSSLAVLLGTDVGPVRADSVSQYCCCGRAIIWYSD